MKSKQQKTKFSEKYINNVKMLFPFIRKSEKTYLRQMRQNIDDYCACTSISSIEELYKEFGEPQDVVYHYFATVNTQQFFSFIRLRRIINHFLIYLGVVLFAVTLFFCIILYREHLVIIRQEAVFTETVIE